MNTTLTFGFIIAVTAATSLFAASLTIATHKAIAATMPTIVNPPITIVNPATCPLGTIPATTTTGTVCVLMPGSGYGYGGFGHHWYHPWYHH